MFENSEIFIFPLLSRNIEFDQTVIFSNIYFIFLFPVARKLINYKIKWRNVTKMTKFWLAIASSKIAFDQTVISWKKGKNESLICMCK